MKKTLKSSGSSHLLGRFLVLGFAAVGAVLLGQEVLTNDTVISMTKAHVDTGTIVDMIQKTPGKYVLTSAALISLKQQGVSDDAIRAMRAKTDGALAPSPKASAIPKANQHVATEADCPSGTAPKWAICDWKDAITGETHFEANTRQLLGGGAKFVATATCSTLDMELKIVYGSGGNSNIGYKLSDGDFLIRKPHVIMRLSLDGRSGTAPSPTADFINEATLVFLRKLSDAERKAVGATGTLLLGLSSIASPAEPDEVYRARVLRVELPLSNGGLPILEIQPQDAEFQRFAGRCNAMVESSARAREEEVRRAEAEKDEKAKAAAAAEAQRTQLAAAAARERLQQEWQKYGGPSLGDSSWNIRIKAELSGNQALTDQVARSVSNVHPVPGSTCDSIFLPGDILSGQQLDWNAASSQTLYARCHKFRERKVDIGQVEIDPKALAELKKRRDQLLTLGVNEKPAPAEPDLPVGALPAPWTTKKWFVCPRLPVVPASPGGKRFVPAVPMEVRFVGQSDGYFYFKFKSGPEGEYKQASSVFKESCSPLPTRR